MALWVKSRRARDVRKWSMLSKKSL